MSTIIPYFDPILGKLRNSDVALISVASLIVTDPLVVNNLIVNTNASINTLYGNTINASTVSTNILISNNITNHSTISTNLIFTNGIIASLVSATTIYSQGLNSSTASIGLAHISNIEWNLTSGGTTALEGDMNWDATQQTVVLGLAGGNVDVALGMENVFPRRVRNSTGSTMPKGTAVYINGVSGNTPTVQRAIATSDMTSAYTLGLTSETINDGATGWVTTFGELTGLNLSAFSAGDTLYLSGATAGAYTNVIQLAPIHYVRLGTVVKATADGVLVVNVINGFETDELHDVAITSLASGQILQSGASSLWYNRSLASAIAENISFLSLGSLAVLNSLALDNLTDVAITSVASGQILINNGTNFVNATPLYMNFYGKYNTDPVITEVRDGDQYWNNLDSKMQVYISEWRELNGPERFKFQDDSLFQMQNDAYFQFQD